MESETVSKGLKKNLIILFASLILIVGFVGANNLMTPEESMEVGFTEISTECFGINAGACIGLQMRDHQTYEYDNYTEIEEGTENYYRRIESELMIRAYDACEPEMEGMDWTDKVEYQNKTASAWVKNDNVNLLPCEKTFYREVEASK